MFAVNVLVVGPFYGLDAEHCAWRCLWSWSSCNAFTVYITNAVPRCVLSASASFNTDLKLASSAPYLSATYYELTSNNTRVLAQAYTEDGTIVPVLASDCSISLIRAQNLTLLRQIQALENCR